MALADTTYRQLLLAAELIAQPKYVSVLFPADAHSQSADLRIFDSAAAKAVIGILSAHGATYANPLRIQAALADLATELDEDEVLTITQLVPNTDTVTLEGVQAKRDDILATYNQRQLAKELFTASQQLLNGRAETATVVVNAQEALAVYRRGKVGRATDAGAIDARLDEGAGIVRYQVAKGIPGGEFIDGQAKGLRPDGSFGVGLLGRTEVAVMVGKYGSGKTRLALNWIVSLLADDASVSILVLEDTEAAYAFKLMAIKFNLESWLIEKQKIVGRSAFIAEHGVETSQKVDQARQWFRDQKPKLSIIDGGAKVNIFDYAKAKALLQEETEVNGRTHIMADYVQQWPGDTTVQEAQAFGLRELAARYNVGMLLMSQMPNSAMDEEQQPGTLPSKGTGTWGQVAHWGYVLSQSPTVGQRELMIRQQKGRNAGLNQWAAIMNVETGTVLRYEGAAAFDAPRQEGSRKRKGGNT